jgi:hypothetical protein
MDGIDLAEMFERASVNRRIAQPRSAIATLIFERMRQHFPDRARSTVKSGQPRRPADQAERHGGIARQGTCNGLARPARPSGWLGIGD